MGIKTPHKSTCALPQNIGDERKQPTAPDSDQTVSFCELQKSPAGVPIIWRLAGTQNYTKRRPTVSPHCPHSGEGQETSTPVMLRGFSNAEELPPLKQADTSFPPR